MKTVSIPNGMEFYEAKHRVRDFSQLRVSIPNGMEFYASLAPGGGVLWEFQFPTGWNSTLFKPSFSLSSLVSIPNGMEFYQIQYFYEIHCV